MNIWVSVVVSGLLVSVTNALAAKDIRVACVAVPKLGGRRES